MKYLKQIKCFLFLILFIGTRIMSHAQVRIDGLYYMLNGNEAILTRHVSGSDAYYGENIIIPEIVKYNGKTYSVTCIAEKAFMSCKIESVIIPNSVTRISDEAFYDCDLKSVVIPSSVTYIGAGAFAGCYNLKEISIPNSVSYIGAGAFPTEWYDNQSEGIIYAGKVAYAYKGEMSPNTKIQIKEGTLCIAEHAFRDKKNLLSIIIPNSVVSIGEEAFYNCENLKTIIFSNSVRSIGHWAFEGTAWLDYQPNGIVYAGKVAYVYKGKMPLNTKIQIKEGTLGIAEYAFSRAENLKSITIPQSVKIIGQSAFSESGLTSITIPNNVAAIEGRTFFYCKNLISASIPITVTSIGESAFSSCINLKSIVIPNNMTSIENHTFSDCASLTSISIPDKITSIGYGAFEGCI